MPPVVENELGKLEFRNELAICVPLIDEASRKIMDKYLVETYGGGAYGVNAPVENMGLRRRRAQLWPVVVVMVCGLCRENADDMRP